MPIRLDTIENRSGSKIAEFASSGDVDYLIATNFNILSKLNLVTWDETTKPTTGLVIGAFGYNTELEALEVYNGQSDAGDPIWVKFAFSSPSIVTQGLIIHLDAGDSTSYPGSGSTWFDLSTSGKNATLQNSPTYDANDGGGCFDFDAANDYISLSTSGVAGPALTFEFWIKKKGNGGYFMAMDNSDNPELRLLFNTSSGNLQAALYDNGAYFYSNNAGPTGGYPNNAWYHIVCAVRNGEQKIYVNGNVVMSGTGTGYDGGSGGNAGEHTIGTYNRPATGYGGYANIKIAQYRLYNKFLSESDVTNNWNVTKGKFGL